MASNSTPKKNKRKQYLLLSLLLTTCFLIILYYFQTHRAILNTEITDDFEPRFKKNGQLAFIKEHSIDTIKIIDIEVAKDDKKRAQGMMWRKSMPDSQGMLFIFNEEGPRSFWMKNTYIPLDIIYVNSSLEIVSIRENAKPLNVWSIPSEYPAKYVVEVNGGYCYKHNIKVGDMILFELTSE